MSAQEVNYAYRQVAKRHGGTVSSDPMTLEHMAARARERLDYNGSRSGYAAPATELARYVLTLVRLVEARA